MVRLETKLICKGVLYHSMIDEEMFFEWLSRIPSIVKIEGMGDELYLYTKNKKIPDNDLREMISIFYRYKVEMSQLQIFLNEENHDWFKGSPRGYWYKKVFENAQKRVPKTV